MSANHKWSFSAVNTLRSCDRKFFFSHILASHGRSNNLRRKAFELRQMQNQEMWQGAVVDKVMEKFIIPDIEAGKELDLQAYIQEAEELARNRFNFSEKKYYQYEGLTKTDSGADFCVLDIHEIAKEWERGDFEKSLSVICTSILNFPSILMPDGKTLLLDYLYDAKKLLPNVTTWQAIVENALVKPQIDLAIFDEFWKPAIIDWKVSESVSSDYEKQLFIIALVVYLTRLEKKDKPAYRHSDIKLFEVNLLGSIVKQYRFTEEEAADLVDYINLTTGDIKLIKEENAGCMDAARFSTTDNHNSCMICNFRMLCGFLTRNKFQYDEESYTQFIQATKY